VGRPIDAAFRAGRDISRRATRFRGKHGTGKELIARAVHRSSSRRNRPLVKVNCASLPASLIESELFGHERGAFTGAMAQHRGRFEVADGGTLFLDEVGELPLELQAKLLRVLQDGELERVGSSATIRVDTRIIAATNRNLLQGVTDGHFRKDLYYRLHVFPVEAPPLRARREDIPLLVFFFVARFARKLGKPVPTVPEEAMRELMRYSWPGNVRELENVVERAAILATGNTLAFDRAWLIAEAQDSATPTTASAGDEAGEGTLADMEKHHILRVLEKTRSESKRPRTTAGAEYEGRFYERRGGAQLGVYQMGAVYARSVTVIRVPGTGCTPKRLAS
jgi:transcriptional regulator with GAF, ATPase, and Fis domain